MWRKPTYLRKTANKSCVGIALGRSPRHYHYCCCQCRPLPSYAVDIGQCRCCHMIRHCLPSSHKLRKCKGELERPQVTKVRGGALMSVISREWRVQCALFIARISQNKISDFARPSHASFKTQAETQIAICVKPGAHPVHMPENPPYARRNFF